MASDPDIPSTFDAGADPSDISAVPTAVALFVGPVRLQDGGPPAVTSYAEYRASLAAPDEDDEDRGMSAQIRSFFANGGERATIAPLEPGTSLTAKRLTTVFESLRSSGVGFNLACLVTSAEEDLSTAAITAALDGCIARRAMLLLDTPSAWCTDPAAAISRAADGADQLRQAIGEHPLRNAALYFPCFTSRGHNGATVALSPCGAVAGVIARVDRERGVWSPPAGVATTIVGAEGLTVSHTDAESTALNLVGVNVLRQFPGRGIVVWGARTLAGSREAGDPYRYLPIRRFSLFIEDSIERGLEFAVFEPNEERLWRQVREEATMFLLRLFAAGALQGRSAAQAFFVRCGPDTMTQDDIDNGRLNVEIGFAPLRPAEFVVIRIGRMLRRPDD